MTSKYEGLLGFAGVPMVSDPRHNFTIVVGRSGEGKSSFLQSGDRLFIINVDLSATTNRKPKAMIWPGVRSDGTPVEPNPEDPLNPAAGIPLSLDYKTILSKRDLLVEMAKDEYPGRPTTVVVDTVDLMYPMLQRWMADQAGKEEFGKLYGPDAWPESYQQVLDFVLFLRRVGYGVILAMHLGDKTIHIGEMKKEYLRDQPMVKDNLWNLLKPHADMIVAIEKETTKQAIKKPILDSVSGKPKINPTTKEPMTTTSFEEVVQHVLTIETTKHQGVLKKRVEIPDRIILPETDAFAVYEAAYRKAALALPD